MTTPLIALIILGELAAATILAGVMVRVGRFKNNPLRVTEQIIFSLVLTPPAIAGILFLSLIAFPKQPNLLYAGIIIGITVFLAVFAWRETGLVLKHILSTAARPFKPAFWRQWLLFKLITAVFAVFVITGAVNGPIVGHDALIYSIYGQTFLDDKSFDNYPLELDEDKNTPAVETSHFPGLPLIYTALAIFSGADNMDTMKKTVSAYYFLCLLILVWYIIHGRAGPMAAYTAITLTAVSPFIYYQVIGNSIDPVRICLLTLAVYSLYLLLIRLDRFSLIICLWSLAAAFFIHAGSMLMLPVMLVTYIILSPRVKRRKLIISSFVGLVLAWQAIVWLGEYSGAYKVPAFVSINPPTIASRLYRSKAIFGDEWHERLKKLEVSAEGMIWKEKLQMLSRPDIFGPVFIIALAATAWWLWMVAAKNKKHPFNLPSPNDGGDPILLDKVMICTGLLFAVPVIYKYYQNYRYISSVFPQALYFASIAMVMIHHRFENKYRWTTKTILWLAQAAVIIMLLTLFFLRTRPLDLSGKNTGICGGVTSINSAPALVKHLVNSTVRNLNRFANWKLFAHPADNTVANLKDIPDDMTITIIADEPEHPRYYHYLKNKNCIHYRDEKFKELAFSEIFFPEKVPSTNLAVPDYLMIDKNTHGLENLWFVLDEGVKYPIFETILKSPMVDEKFNQRGIHIFKVRKDKLPFIKTGRARKEGGTP